MYINSHIFKSNLKFVYGLLCYTKMSNNDYDMKKDIIEDLDLIFELYCDTHDTRLHEIYLKYYIKNYMILIMIYE